MDSQFVKFAEKIQTLRYLADQLASHIQSLSSLEPRYFQRLLAATIDFVVQHGHCSPATIRETVEEALKPYRADGKLRKRCQHLRIKLPPMAEPAAKLPGSAPQAQPQPRFRVSPDRMRRLFGDGDQGAL